MITEEKIGLFRKSSMPAITLKEKLAERAKLQERGKDTHWDKRKDSWIEQVIKLYDTIEQWLQEYIHDGYMVCHRSKKAKITEKDIGTYDIDILEIDIEGDIVVFEPIGTNVIGASGRIDVYLRGHKADHVMLLLFDTNGDREQNWRWKLVFEEDYFDFNKARFEELLLFWFEKWAEL